MNEFWVSLLCLIVFATGLRVGGGLERIHHECPKALPIEVTDMFTVSGDTIYLKQGVDFTISTHSVLIDSSGLIFRK